MANPLDYMPYMESHFERLTGVKLTSVSHFTGWIKPGSYYHGVVARQGQLGLCMHLAGHNPPRGPLVPPHPTHPATHEQKETPGSGLHISGKRSGSTQVTCSDSTSPMDTGGAGDSRSWEEWTEAEEWTGSTQKCHRSHSKRWNAWPVSPFSLQDTQRRWEAAQQLYWHTGELMLANHQAAA